MTANNADDSPFPNYMQMRRRLPIGAWHLLRGASVATFFAVVVALLVRPTGALFFFWRVLVPALPLVFFLAPGVWRNVCPLAAANQVPRLLGFTKGLSTSQTFKDRSYLVAIALFVTIVSTRKVIFDDNGGALAALLLAAIVSAFVGGVLFKGKSGWCSSICPLLPVQRLYGQTPFVTIPNSHCQPCVGCTRNCYDFNPKVAYQADMYERDLQWSAPRKLFAGAFPGIVVAFFEVATPPAIPIPEMYLRFAISVLVSAGSFFLIDATFRITTSKLAAVYGAAALNLFYWYNSPSIAGAIGEVTGADVRWLVWPLRVAVLILTLVWVVRTFRTERQFVDQALGAGQASLRLAPSQESALLKTIEPGTGLEVKFVPEDRRVVASAGASILDVAEGAQLPIEAGCRVGMCGSDPVAIKGGMENLSPVGGEEGNTLRRLGMAANTRMACSARLQGPVCVSLTPDSAEGEAETGPASFDPSISSVVVIGNGIAGITAADFVRRRHPECEVHVIGKEPHGLYNRMAITRLIYGRSAMQGLYLLPDSWYEEHRITCWLNTRAQGIDLDRRQVALGTGETLPFDRLILAMGSSSFIPPIPGYGLPGSFPVREAEDAINIRRFVQQHGSRDAVVAGGGLLGLEAAYALQKLGLRVSVLERGDRLLRNQIDERCSGLLASYIGNLGIEVIRHGEAKEIQGKERVERVELTNGTVLPCDVFVVCVGIRPNVELAQAAGLLVKRGVVVDDTMRTSASDVYAAGDVAELEGQVLGLWPTAVSQGEVAAINALGGGESHVRALPVAILKGVGIDLMSVGRFEPKEGDEVIVVEEAKDYSYGKLVVAENRLVGALLLGRPADAPHVLAAVKNEADLTGDIEALRTGDWRSLNPASSLQLSTR